MDHRPKLAVRSDGGSHNADGDDGLAVENIDGDGGLTSKADKANLVVEDETRTSFNEELDRIIFEGLRVRVPLDALSIDIVLNETNGDIELVQHESGKVFFRFASMLAFRSFLHESTLSDIVERVYLSVDVNSENFGGVDDGGGSGGDDDGGGSSEIIEVGETEKRDFEDDGNGSLKGVKELEEKKKGTEVEEDEAKFIDGSVSFPNKPKDTTPVLQEISNKTRETRGLTMLIHKLKKEVRKAQGRVQSNSASLMKDHAAMESLLQKMKKRCDSIEEDQKRVQFLENELDKVARQC